MSTGYTYKIEEVPGYTAKQYIEHCAHNFGLLYHLKEEQNISLPDTIPLDTYSNEKYIQAKVAQESFTKLTLAERKQQYREWVKQTKEQNLKWKKEYEEKDSRYRAMLEKLNSWNPTSSIANNIKIFAISQIKDSTWYRGPFLIEIIPYTQWVENTLEKLELDVNYYLEQKNKDEKRNYESNLVLQKLKQDLKSL